MDVDCRISKCIRSSFCLVNLRKKIKYSNLFINPNLISQFATVHHLGEQTESEEMKHENNAKLVGVIVGSVKMGSKNGSKVARFKVKTEFDSKFGLRSYTNNVACWGEKADIVSGLSDGDAVSVSGRLSTVPFEKNGSTQFWTCINANEVKPVGDSNRSRELPEDDMPF